MHPFFSFIPPPRFQNPLNTAKWRPVKIRNRPPRHFTARPYRPRGGGPQKHFDIFAWKRGKEFRMNGRPCGFHLLKNGGGGIFKIHFVELFFLSYIGAKALFFFFMPSLPPPPPPWKGSPAKSWLLSTHLPSGPRLSAVRGGEGRGRPPGQLFNAKFWPNILTKKCLNWQRDSSGGGGGEVGCTVGCEILSMLKSSGFETHQWNEIVYPQQRKSIFLAFHIHPSLRFLWKSTFASCYEFYYLEVTPKLKLNPVHGVTFRNYHKLVRCNFSE